VLPRSRWRPLDGLVPKGVRGWIGANPKRRRLLIVGVLAAWALLPGPTSVLWPALIPVGMGVAGFRRRHTLARAALTGWGYVAELRRVREPRFDHEPILDAAEVSSVAVETSATLRDATIELGETSTGLEAVMRAAPAPLAAASADPMPENPSRQPSGRRAIDEGSSATLLQPQPSVAADDPPNAAMDNQTTSLTPSSETGRRKSELPVVHCTIDRVVAMHGRDGVPIRVHVRVFERAGAKPVVVYEPVAPDMPVTPAAAIIATRVRDSLLSGAEAEHIEHHPRALAPHGAETFTSVAFRRGRRSGYDQPRWTPLSRSDVEKTIGRRLAPPGRGVGRRLDGQHKDLFLA